MLENLDEEVADAVEYYYETLTNQAEEQRDSDNSTRGRRAEVLGGQQMDGFAGLVEDLLHIEAGVPRDAIKHDYHATLPGFYRHEKEWDTAVVYDDELLAVIEYKSQGSSIGNNLNNRAEEAIGSNTDLYKAYEEGLFEPSPSPWVGYLMLMVDHEESRRPRSLPSRLRWERARRPWDLLLGSGPPSPASHHSHDAPCRRPGTADWLSFRPRAAQNAQLSDGSATHGVAEVNSSRR